MMGDARGETKHLVVRQPLQRINSTVVPLQSMESGMVLVGTPAVERFGIPHQGNAESIRHAHKSFPTIKNKKSNCYGS